MKWKDLDLFEKFILVTMAISMLVAMSGIAALVYLAITWHQK